MYNEYDKIKWMEEYRATNKIDPYRLPKIFQRTEPYEEKLQKDLCNFSSDEAEKMFAEIGYTSLQFLKVEISLIRSYVDWQIGNGNVTDGINHFVPRELTQKKLRDMIKRKTQIVDREQLIEWCKKLYNPCDCVVLLGLFEGIKGADYCEFVRLTTEDINEERQTVKLYGRSEELKVSKELIDYMIKSGNTNIYLTYGVMRSGHTLESSSKIIKDAPNTTSGASDFRLGRRIYTRTRTLFEFLGVTDWMNAGTLVESGIVSMVQEGSKEAGIGWRDYVASESGRDEIYKRFQKHIQPFQFILEYEDYLG